MGVFGRPALELHAGRQGLEAAGVGVGDGVALIVFVIAQRGAVAVGRGEKPHLGGADAGGDNGGLFVAVEHLQAADAGVHGGHAAHLLGPVGLEDVQHLVGIDAREGGLPAGAGLDLAQIQPVGDGLVVGVDFHAHDGAAAFGQVAGVLHGQALDLDQAQGVAVGVAGGFAGELQQQGLAIARPGFDDHALHVGEAEAARDFAGAAA